MTNSDFVGESYFEEVIPDYAWERQMVLVKLFFSFCAWIVVIPTLFIQSESKDTTTITSIVKEKSGTRTTRKIIRVKQAKRKQDANSNLSNKSTLTDVTLTKAPLEGMKRVATGAIDWKINFFCFVSCTFHFIFIIFRSSPDNYFTSRTVFETPLFTKSECGFLINMAERVARQNFEKAERILGSPDEDVDREQMMGYLNEPKGWQKSRHEQYPTTDLNVVTDGFSDEDQEWLRERLDARLAPTLERIFGVPPSSIRANDMFFVRYDGDRQASLAKHTDDGSITFSVLLSDGFEGGGTRYWNRHSGAPFSYVLPKAGMMQTFPSLIQHEGVQTERGRRYLLIGFLAVDKIDPWSHRSTGLSFFASWGSLNWAAKKLKEGASAAWSMKGKSSSRLIHDSQVGHFFALAHANLIRICDEIFPHRFAVLVNEANAEGYLDELDKAYQKKRELFSLPADISESSWFDGQQANVNIDGTFLKWKS